MQVYTQTNVMTIFVVSTRHLQTL